MFKLSLPGKVKPVANRAYYSILDHKILILVLIMLSLVGGILIQLRENFISQIKIAQVNNSAVPVLSESQQGETTQTASDSAEVPESQVLGISTETTTYSPIYYPSLAPIPTFSPIPTPTSTYTPAPSVVSSTAPTTVITPSVSAPASSSSSGHTCASMGVSPGVATEWYSDASPAQTVWDTATITIDLKDCNDEIAPVSDTLTISRFSGLSTTVNGSSPPITIVTSNGRASFTVKSKTSGTAVYTVRNTTKSFNVTAPGGARPQVTFTVSAPASSSPSPTPASNMASPTPSPSPSPSPSAPASTTSPTPSPSPASSPSPTSSAASSPSSSLP